MLLEVASTGTPILASDIPENEQVFTAEEVLFFESENVDNLANRLEWVSGNMATFKAIGLRAKEKVISNYRWDKIVGEYKRLYGDG